MIFFLSIRSCRASVLCVHPACAVQSLKLLSYHCSHLKKILKICATTCCCGASMYSCVAILHVTGELCELPTNHSCQEKKTCMQFTAVIIAFCSQLIFGSIQLACLHICYASCMIHFTARAPNAEATHGPRKLAIHRTFW